MSAKKVGKTAVVAPKEEKKEDVVMADASKEEKKVVVVPPPVYSSAERDWGARWANKDHINGYLSRLFKQYLINNVDPRIDMFFACVQPGMGDDGSNKKGQRKKRKSSAGRGYNPDKKFINYKWVKEPDGWRVLLVWPLSDVYFATLGLGNWQGDPQNKGKDFLTPLLKQAHKSIGLSAQGWEGVPCDDKGRSLDFMEAVAKDDQIATQLCEFIIKDRPDINQGYVDGVIADLVKEKVGKNTMGWDASMQIYENQLVEGTINKTKYNEIEARLKKQYLIGSDGKVDEEKVKASLTLEEKVQKLKDKHYTKALKESKNGIEYIEFKVNCFRPATDAELKKGVQHPNAACHQFFEQTGNSGKPSDRKMVYNHHTFDFMAHWGDKKPAFVVDEKQREVDGLAHFERPLDLHSKIGLVYSMKFFGESPQKTVGFRREFETILFYRGPTDEEVARAKSASSLKLTDDQKMVIPGAQPQRKTELSKPVWATDEASQKAIAELVAMQAKLEAQGDQSKGGSSSSSGDAGAQVGDKRKRGP